MKRITSPHNPLVKYYWKLLQGKIKAEDNNFKLPLEGFNLLEEAIRNGFPVDYIIYCPEKLEGGTINLLQEELPADTQLVEAPASLLNKLSLTENPQGVVGVVDYPAYSWKEMEEATSPLWVLVDKIQDPGNLGTIIRTAAAAGFSSVVCAPGTVFPFNPKVLRSSSGSIFHLKVGKVNSAAEFLQELKEHHRVKVVAAELRGAEGYFQADLTPPIALIMGNERSGISGEFLALADVKVCIPQEEKVDSLNAAVAAGIIMFEIRRQWINRP